MKINKINHLFYSPTSTTKKIVTSIGKYIDCNIKIDIPLIGRKLPFLPSINSLTIIGTPVYGGRVPLEAIEKLSLIEGDQNLAVVIVAYGNRDFDDALLELKRIVINQGFKVIAAGAFIGEHSLFTPEKYIAKDRPDKQDLKIVKEFSKSIINKIESENFDKPSVSGNVPYKERNKKPPLSPDTDETICIKCGACLDACPVDAIDIHELTTTNRDACLWCNACIRACPTNARVLSNSELIKKVDALHEKCQVRKIPELFL